MDPERGMHQADVQHHQLGDSRIGIRRQGQRLPGAMENPPDHAGFLDGLDGRAHFGCPVVRVDGSELQTPADQAGCPQEESLGNVRLDAGSVFRKVLPVGLQDAQMHAPASLHIPVFSQDLDCRRHAAAEEILAQFLHRLAMRHLGQRLKRYLGASSAPASA